MSGIHSGRQGSGCRNAGWTSLDLVRGHRQGGATDRSRQQERAEYRVQPQREAVGRGRKQRTGRAVGYRGDSNRIDGCAVILKICRVGRGFARPTVFSVGSFGRPRKASAHPTKLKPHYFAYRKIRQLRIGNKQTPGVWTLCLHLGGHSLSGRSEDKPLPINQWTSHPRRSGR
jgi:hypothetical protein